MVEIYLTKRGLGLERTRNAESRQISHRDVEKAGDVWCVMNLAALQVSWCWAVGDTRALSTQQLSAALNVNARLLIRAGEAGSRDYWREKNVLFMAAHGRPTSLCNMQGDEGDDHELRSPID